MDIKCRSTVAEDEYFCYKLSFTDFIYFRPEEVDLTFAESNSTNDST